MQNLINTNLGQYRLIEVIGRGRLSTVYKAYQPSLHRFVAVKVLHHLDILGAKRFEREAQMIAQLHHPNILPIFDYGQQNDLRYFVTQYVEQSVTLSTLLAEQQIDDVAALHLIKHLLGALAYAHSRGIIHRDIKPANILLPLPTWPLLADFGIAKILDDPSTLTPPGQTVGTATYIAPELARGLPADTRSDLYSVGVVLYELVTGQIPFDAVTPSAVLNMHIHAAPPLPRDLRPELPAEVEALLLRALKKNPADRYQSADEMSAAVEQVAARLERKRTLVALLGSSAAGLHTPSYITRKLEADSAGLAEAAQRSQARFTPHDQAMTNANRRGQSAALPSGDRVRGSWRVNPPLIVVIAVGLISGMLAAYLLRSRVLEGGPAPQPTPSRTTRTLTPNAARGQSLFSIPTGLPIGVTSGPDQTADFSPDIPLRIEPPLDMEPAPGVPLVVPTSTSTPAAPDSPPIQPPIPTLEPSVVALTPETATQTPADAPAPSPSPEE